MLLDILLIFLAAAGIAMILWCVAGIFFFPVFADCVTVFYIKENADALEWKIRAYAWLRGSGIVGGRALLVDCGLNHAAEKRMQRLCEQYVWLECCKKNDCF